MFDFTLEPCLGKYTQVLSIDRDSCYCVDFRSGGPYVKEIYIDDKELNLISLEDYEKLLKQHDWYYMMSDDSRAYRRGLESLADLKAHRHDSAAHNALFNSYQQAHKL